MHQWMSLLTGFAVVLAAGPATCEAQDVRQEFLAIENSYRAEIRNAADRAAQVEAGRVHTKRLQQTVARHYPHAGELSVEDRFYLALACEKTGAGDQCEMLAQQVLESQPDHAQAAAILIRHFTRQGECDTAVQLLAEATAREKDQRQLLPYWGSIGIRNAQLQNHQESIFCFEKYIDSRFRLVETDMQPLEALPAILPILGEQYFLLGQHARFLDRLAAWRDRLDGMSADWPTAVASAGDLNRQLNRHYFYLVWDSLAENPVAFQSGFAMLELIIAHPDWSNGNRSVEPLVKLAGEEMIQSSHLWENPAEIDRELFGYQQALQKIAGQNNLTALVQAVRSHARLVHSIEESFRAHPVDNLATIEFLSGLEWKPGDPDVPSLVMMGPPSLLNQGNHRRLAEKFSSPGSRRIIICPLADARGPDAGPGPAGGLAGNPTILVAEPARLLNVEPGPLSGTPVWLAYRGHDLVACVVGTSPAKEIEILRAIQEDGSAQTDSPGN